MDDRIEAAPRIPFSGPTHRWHVAINAHASAVGHKDMRFMYEAKDAAGEAARLPVLFKMEREGTLRKRHHQCSHDHDGEPVSDNHLTCCLGVECRKCPHLLALDSAELEPDEKDVVKAWTCVTCPRAAT